MTEIRASSVVAEVTEYPNKVIRVSSVVAEVTEYPNKVIRVSSVVAEVNDYPISRIKISSVIAEVNDYPISRIKISSVIAEVCWTPGKTYVSSVVAEVSHEISSITKVSSVVAEVDLTVPSMIIVSSVIAEVVFTYTPALPCTTTIEQFESISTQYYLKLLDHSGNMLAIFDVWRKLSYSTVIRDVGEFSIEFEDNGDTRLTYFDTDYIIEVYRQIPGCGVTWYVDFRGFCRKFSGAKTNTGENIFVVSGFDLNDLLVRRVIAYREGTIRAEKSCPAETAIKEYVEENCGPSATPDLRGVATSDSVGVLGTFPGFSVDTDAGLGVIWDGIHAFDSLLDSIQDIANFADMDFGVFWNGKVLFEFRTFADQYGDDKTNTSISVSTGKNIYGNYPIVMSVEAGNVVNSEYTLDRSSEKNVVLVPGKGTRSTRNLEHVSDPTNTVQSPWNTCEVVRNGSSLDYAYQLKAFGEEQLRDLTFKELFEFIPLQQPSCLYGKHYFVGDRLTVRHGDIYRNKRITSVNVTVTSDSQEIELQFKDIP